MVSAQEAARALRRWGLAAMGLTALCYAANAWLGPLNQDEGWYLLAARRVMAGELPHRDFFFTQGPVAPLAYALLGWLWSPFGVLGGRLVTAAMGFAALAVGAETAAGPCRRDDERWTARLVFWAFAGLSLWMTYFTCIPKAYALCALLLALALRWVGPQGAAWRFFGAGLALALAAGARLSMGVLLPTVGLWLLFRREWAGPRAWVWFGLGGALGLAAVFGPWLALWPESFFGAQAFHAARERMGLLGPLGCVARFCRFNPLPVALGVFVGWLAVTGRPQLRKLPQAGTPLPGLWLLCAGALAAAHLAAPVPYDDYLAPALLPLAMALAAGFAMLPFEAIRLALAKALVPAALLVAVGGSPLAEAWFSAGQDRFWPRLKAEPDLALLRRAAGEARAAAGRLGTRVIWTQETYLAVEAGLDVPRGLEMGPFSKPAPLDPAAAPLAAWAGYTFALRFPDLAPAPDREARLGALRAAYGRTLGVFPGFGQGHTTLTLAERTAP